MKNSLVIFLVVQFWSRTPTTGKHHLEEVRSYTLNFPLVCSAFVEASSLFFQANFHQSKAYHLSFQGTLWVGIFPFSLLLLAEGQLELVTPLFEMLELFIGGYRQHLMWLIPVHVLMKHGMLSHHPH